jgi:hypothetical protein
MFARLAIEFQTSYCCIKQFSRSLKSTVDPMREKTSPTEWQLQSKPAKYPKILELPAPTERVPVRILTFFNPQSGQSGKLLCDCETLRAVAFTRGDRGTGRVQL